MWCTQTCCQIYHLLPYCNGMEKLFPSPLCNVSDNSFSHVILELGSLLLLQEAGDTCIVSKAAIVDMVVFNSDKTVGINFLKA